MELLALSILALVVGPLLVHFLGRRPGVSIGLDAFVLVIIAGLVFLHILPEGLQTGGWPALVATALGLMIPTLGERILKMDLGKTHRAVLVLGLVALGTHAFLDGMVLAGGEGASDHQAEAHEHPGHGSGSEEHPSESDRAHDAESHTNGLLSLGIILHRIPVSIGIWWIVRGALGMRVAMLLLLAMAGATSAGFLSAGPVYRAAHGPLVAVLQCLLAGSLLHVVLHRHGISADEHERGPRLVSGLGGLAGVAVLLAMPDHGHHMVGGGLDLFLTLAFKSAPALLLAYFIVGFTHVLMPASWLGFLSRGSRLSQATRGVALGLPIPVCSCGVVPVYRELVSRGVPISAAIAFLIATPELDLAAALLSFELLGYEVALFRLLCAFLLAILVGVIVSAWGRARQPEAEQATRTPATESLRRIVGRGLSFGLGEAVDDTAPWILLGLIVAAMLSPILDPTWISALSPALEVPLLALIGLPIYVCASGSTPLAAVLLMSGLSPGAAIAFLLTGPATNVTTVGVLSRLHGRRAAVFTAVVIILISTLLGWLVNAFIPAPATPPMGSYQEEGATLLETLSAAGLLLLFTASLLRQGTRGFVGRVIESPLFGHETSCAAEAKGCC